MRKCAAHQLLIVFGRVLEGRIARGVVVSVLAVVVYEVRTWEQPKIQD